MPSLLDPPADDSGNASGQGLLNIPPSPAEAQILAALASIERYSPKLVGGTEYPTMGLVGRTPEEAAWARAMGAATALRAAQENQRLPPDAPRVTDPLDRARYMGF
jgi:hypothetical protein